MSSAAITKRTVLTVIEENREKFALRLPPGMDQQRFVLGLATAIQKSKANSKEGKSLLDCDPTSVMLAAYEAAECGCDLSPSLGLGWLVPLDGLAQFWPSYRFFIQKAHETGDVKTFFAEVVYAGDRFERQFAPKRNLFHAPGDGVRTKAEAIGAYALVEFNEGTIDWEYLTAEQIDRHRAHSKQPNSMKWTTFWEEGFRITPIRVLAKRLPIKSRGLEKLVEVISKDEESDLLTRPDGTVELAPDSPLHARIPSQPSLPNEPASAEGFRRAGVAPAMLTYTVGTEDTTIVGNVTKLAADLKHLQARPQGKDWTIPAGRTQDFVDLCDKRGVIATEETAEPPREPGE